MLRFRETGQDTRGPGIHLSFWHFFPAGYFLHVAHGFVFKSQVGGIILRLIISKVYVDDSTIVTSSNLKLPLVEDLLN